MYGNAYIIRIKTVIHTRISIYVAYKLIHKEFQFRICCNAKMTENKELNLMQKLNPCWWLYIKNFAYQTNMPACLQNVGT